MKKGEENKMKKSFAYGLAMSVSALSIGAYAAPGDDASSAALTTKGYVDTGLKYVYDSAKGDITNLQTTVGAPANGVNPATGLVGDVADLQTTVGTPSDGINPGTGLVGEIAALTEDVDDLADDVSDLQTAVGDANSGLIKKVNDLESASQTYNAGAGVAVTAGANAGDPATISLALPNNPTAGASYVFKPNNNGGGTWETIEVEDTWDPGFLTTP